MLNFFPKLFNKFSVIKIYFFDFLFIMKTKMKKEKLLLLRLLNILGKMSFSKEKKETNPSKILVNNKKLKVQFFAILRKYEKFFKLIN